MTTNKPIYYTTYCNQGHYLTTGRPVGHECYILPPAALRAEQAGDYDGARRILATVDYKRRGTVKGRSAPLVAHEGCVYDKPTKYHKTCNCYTVKQEGVPGAQAGIYDVWYSGGDAALPYGVIEKKRDNPLWHVGIYKPGHAGDFTYARTVTFAKSMQAALAALRIEHDTYKG